MSTPLPASENRSVYDEKHRKIILKESLVAAPEPSIRTNEIVNSPQDDDWTQHNWQKAGSSNIPQRLGKGKKAWRNQLQMTKPNVIQKKLEEALAKPVQLTKAESMMQKMGWQGGALGKTGTGIMEPVAPNAAYAVKTRGFGQASHTPDPPPPKKKKINQRQNKKQGRETFYSNVLQQILEFVKNDYESEIMFDKNLFRGERKQIHNLVNEVINENDVASLGSIALMDLVQEIRAHNYYVLCTQSQGTHPDRALCLFKEAPEHVYLLTPKDLREQNDNDDELDRNTEENCSNSQNNEIQENMNKDLNDIGILNEMVKKGNENIHREQRDSLQSIIGESENIDGSVNKEVTVASSICKVVEQSSYLYNNDNKEFKHTNESNKIIKDITVKENDNSNELKNSHVNLNKGENTESKDCNSLNDSLKQSVNIDENVNVKEGNNDEPISIDSEENQKIDIAGKLKEYFKEFAESEDHSEMRFLGPFTSEEMYHVNSLVSNLYYYVNHDEDNIEEMYKELFKDLYEERYIFEVKEDINWSPVIYKTDTFKEKQKSTEDDIILLDAEES